MEWRELQDMADGILAWEPKAFIQAIDASNPFSEVYEFGAYFAYGTEDGHTFEVKVHVKGEEVIPSESKSLLKSGKLSIKKLPKTKFYELYQDHICGIALRIGRELFALLPSDKAIVNVVTDLVNASTGRLEEQAILSIALVRETIDKLDFEYLDPSECMSNFIHEMKFLATKGFQPVEKIDSSLLD